MIANAFGLELVMPAIAEVEETPRDVGAAVTTENGATTRSIENADKLGSDRCMFNHCGS